MNDRGKKNERLTFTSEAVQSVAMSSKLDSCLAEIVAARAARKSWREIVALLSECGIKTNVSGVYQYFHRARKKQVALDRELRPFGQHAPPIFVQPIPSRLTSPDAESSNPSPAAAEGEPEKLVLQKPRPRPPVQERKRIFDISEEDLINLERNPILPTDKPE